MIRRILGVSYGLAAYLSFLTMTSSMERRRLYAARGL
jgi:hypothetical protein